MIRTYIDDKLNIIVKMGDNVMLRNPYTPGAGTPPAFLAGRDATINEAATRITDTIAGNMARHTIYYGVRGVGKTVLLNKIESIFQDDQLFYEHIECVEGFGLAQLITVVIKKFIKKMSLLEASKDLLENAIDIFKAFTLTWSPSDGSITAGLSGEIAKSDPFNTSPNFSGDLTELLIAAGQLAKKNSHAVCFFIDEIQALKISELSALITSIHRINQLQLPIIIIGAGLPTILRITNEVKSYSERLFNYIHIDSLKTADAVSALVEPAKIYNVQYEKEAVDFIVEKTGGYPYFLQEYGRCIWDYIEDNNISLSAAKNAYADYIGILDKSFFSARYNRTTTKEKEFLVAMANCKKYPCPMSLVASNMNKKQSAISQFRNNLINKGLVYSPAYGEVDFTVPHFDAFLKRKQVN